MNITGVLGGSLRCDEPRPLPRGGGGRRDKRTEGGGEGAADVGGGPQ